ncbi:hypothetical protein CB0940_02361 [Cercospora beticola]|uniref:Uncharacterized protein n=1 Tax=Cercospora beticola TaxID=122368 RepID=A0A2G5I1X0_CERBT|nr:hypothetical protein CB0940_02361 [Cercospora beticola]PIA98796.1 hypothetical protein CB0940_02361 [Cercospora beticola]WPA99494.1 hypothetical protein RHO25_004112 [Cercospora beticola]
MMQPEHERPSRLKKRGHVSTGVAEDLQSDVVRPNDQFVLPIRTAVASNGVDPDPSSRPNAPAPSTQGSDVNPLLRTTDYLQHPIYLGSRSVSVDAAANVNSSVFLGSHATAPALEHASVDRLHCPPAPRKPSAQYKSRSSPVVPAGSVSSDNVLGSYATAPALQGSNVNSPPRPPELLDPSVFYRSGSVSVDGSGNVNSNLPLRSYPATPAFQSFNIIPPFRFPGPPHPPGVFPSGSVVTEAGTPVDAAETANEDETEDSAGVEAVIKLVKKLPLLELVYLAEVVEVEVKARGIPQLGRASYHSNDRLPTKFDKARSGRMIEEGRKLTERMAADDQRFAEIGKKRRRMEEQTVEGVRMLREGLLKIQANVPTEQGHAGL